MGRDDEERIAALTPEQREILLKRLQAARSRAPAAPIERVPRGEWLELSSGQERLWFLWKLDPASPAYNVSVCVRIRGDLDVAKLERAMTQLIARHEVLRTRFGEHDGRAMQRIEERASLRLGVEQVGADQLAARAAELARQPFDLEHGTPVRAHLLRLGVADHVLVVSMHHIASDAWSLGVSIRELTQLYAGEELSPLALGYADYAAWQRARVRSDAFSEQLAYWKHRLEGVPALELPADRSRPRVPSGRGSEVRGRIERELVVRVRERARAHGATDYMVLLGAFVALLSRYTRKTDIAVGAPVAGRNREELEPLVGFFVNTLVLRVDVSGHPTFDALIDRVREAALGAYSHQEVPFDRVIDAISPERNTSVSPLFQVMFVLHNVPPARLRLGDLELEASPLDLGSSQFDLTLEIEPREDEALTLRITYSTDLFERASIERMLARYVRLLGEAAREPATRIDDLSILAEDERRRQLVDWNATAVPVAEERVDQLIAEQARRTPDTIALALGDAALTYGELDARSAALARALGALGVGAESLVGVCLERSFELVIALFGVFRAGGAYVSLDPTHPAERSRFMIEDAGVSAVVTDGSLRPLFAGVAAPIVELGALEPSRDHADGAGHVDHVGYVLYTSGSTGKPKAVLSHHRGLANRLAWMQHRFALDRTDAVLHKTPFTFDVSAWEIFWPLMVGARLVIAEPQMHKDAEQLTELIERSAVTTVHFVPSMLAAWLEAPGVTRCSSLRRVICSGEALTPPHVRRFFARLGAELHNLYGPTEASIDVSHWECTRALPDDVCIGRPIWNTELYVVDEALGPAPIGVPGELLIGGVQLARGYHRRPALTADRFVPDPLGATRGARVYRTGDLARFRWSGDIEYLGRTDHQVKLRGFRIELGEIESALEALSAVQRAVVVVRQDRPGEKLLAAYLTSRTGAAIDVDDVRARVSAVLADYMVPSAFVVLEAMPLTTSGKIDRNALPAVTRTLTTEHVPPATKIETALVDVWRRVLGVERVGVMDNFFALGGDSIRLLEVCSRAREVGVVIRPRQMFEHPTIRGAASVARTQGSLATEQAKSQGRAELSPIQHWFFEQDLPASHHYNQAMMLVAHERLSAERVERALAAVIDHHDALRLGFARAQDGEWVGSFHETSPDAAVLEVIDASRLDGAARARALEQESERVQAGLDLARGPLIRVALFELGPSAPQRLLIAAHHLVIDGVSWRILLDDFLRAYRQLSNGTTVALPSKTTSWQTWTRRLSEWARGPELDAEAPYWRSVSRRIGSRPLRAVPRGANTEAEAATFELDLDPQTAEAFARDVPPGDGAETVLLCALARAVARETQTASVAIDVEAHGREDVLDDVDLSRTVGWFTTLFPVVFEGASTDELLDALEHTKRALDSVPRRGIGYGALRYLRGDPELASGAPQPGILFNYHAHADAALKQTTLAAAEESPGRQRAAAGTRRHLLEVIAEIAGGRLRVRWTYATRAWSRSEMEALARSFESVLGELVSLCTEGAAGERLGAGAGARAPQKGDDASADPEQPSVADAALARSEEPIGAEVPVSFIEERFYHWWAEGAPLSAFRILWHVLVIEGELAIPVLEQTLTTILERHEVLRSRYRSERGVVTKTIEPITPVRALVTDLRDVPAEQRWSRAVSLLVPALQERFDLAHEPPIRFRLCRMEDRKHLLAIALDHIVADATSRELLLGELAELSRAALAGDAPLLPLGPQYTDFAYWQRRWASRDFLPATYEFWRRHLAGATATSPKIAADFPREPVESQRAALPFHAGACSTGFARWSLGAATVRAISSLAAETSSIPQMVALAALAAVLHRHSGSRDVLINNLNDFRNRTEGLEHVIGNFTNFMLVRLNVDASMTVRELLRETREEMARILARPEFPIIPAVYPTFGDEFRTVLNYVPALGDRRALSFPGLTIDALGPEQLAPWMAPEKTQFDLLFFVSAAATGWAGVTAYNADLWSAATIERIVADLVTALEAMARTVDVPLGALFAQ